MELKPYKNYFKWDYSARHDQKLSRLLRIEGYEGYGLFVAIVELLHEYQGCIDLETIQYELRYDGELLNRILNDYNLFIEEDNCYTNKRVVEQLEFRKEKSKKAKESINKRWNK